MAGSIGNSVQLMKASMNVLKLDKELLVFPVMSGIATVIVTASFIAPIALTNGWSVFEEGGGDYLAMAVMFMFYVVMYTVIFFFNSALVGAALIRLEGGDPTVGDGLRIARQHLGPHRHLLTQITLSHLFCSDGQLLQRPCQTTR